MIARSEPAPASRDPLVWCWLLTAAFLALLLHRLAIPSKEYFDEIHYLPAARNLLVGRRTRRVIRLGDKVTVQVAKVDSFKKQVDFRLAQTARAQLRPPQPPRPAASRHTPRPSGQAPRPSGSKPGGPKPAFTLRAGETRSQPSREGDRPARSARSGQLRRFR